MKKTQNNISHSTLLLHTILICASIFAIFPFYVMLMMSTYPDNKLNYGIKLFPGNYLFENLKTIFSSYFLLSFFNSIKVSVTNTILSMFISTMAGYGFAKYSFKGKKILFSIVLMILVIPGQLATVGFVMEMKAFGWVNTLLPFIIPCASPFGVFLMASYMQNNLPSEVLNSARIDGCSEFAIFLRIVIPMSKPALGTLALLGFLASWNNYFMPRILISKQNLYTIPLFVSTLTNLYSRDRGAQLICLTLATIPILTVFSIFNKSMIRGIVMGSVK